mgnify:FL=1
MPFYGRSFSRHEGARSWSLSKQRLRRSLQLVRISHVVLGIFRNVFYKLLPLLLCGGVAIVGSDSCQRLLGLMRMHSGVDVRWFIQCTDFAALGLDGRGSDLRQVSNVEPREPVDSIWIRPLHILNCSLQLVLRISSILVTRRLLLLHGHIHRLFKYIIVLIVMEISSFRWLSNCCCVIIVLMVYVQRYSPSKLRHCHLCLAAHFYD